MTHSGGMARNVIAGVVSQAFGLLLAFFATPILVRGLGAADYGLWSVSLSVGGWVGFINMIFSTSAIRFIGQALGKGDAAAVRQNYTAIRRWALVCGGAGAVALAAASPWLAKDILSVPEEHLLVAQQVLVLQAFFAFFQIQAATGHGMIAAHQRLDVSYAIRTLGAWLASGGAAFFVWRQAGLISMAAWVVLMQALEWLAVLIFSYWRLQEPAAQTKSAPSSWLRWGSELWRYALPLLGGYLSAQLFLPMSRILVGSMRTLNEVAYFAVPLTIAINVKALSTYVASAVLPAVSQHMGRNDLAGLRHLYLRGLRWSWLAIVPPGILAIALGHSFVAGWISPEFGRYAAPVIAPLVLAVNVYYFSAIPEIMAQGMGRPLPWAVFSTLVGLLHVLFGRVWIAEHGAVGAAYALLAAGCVLTGGLMIWIGRVLSLSLRMHLQAFDVRLLSAALVVGLFARLIVARIELSVLGVLAVGVAGLLAVAATAPWWMVSEERSWVSQRLRRFRPA